MAEQPKTIDISDVPEILRLAEEVRRSNQPRILQRAGEDVAVVVPLPAPKKRRAKRTLSEADRAAFRSAAGGWKGLVDTDQLIKDVYESRRISTRPPVEL
ncbi:MAG: hypothetical protein NVS2B16_32560 [Chloroflexota bacterium]